MLSLFTVLSSHAEGFESFRVGEQHCQNGAGLKASAAEKASRTEYQIEDGFTKITVKTGDESDAAAETFKLVQLAKNAFMAVPEIAAQGPGKQFFVMVSKTTGDLVIYSTDSLGEKCGGEMVLSQLARGKITGTLARPASKRDASAVF